uniref:Ephexin-1-like n=1 Tax=Xenopus tropicalis TaxID=8364 RepID=A0A803J9S4_XENTR
MPVYLGAGQDHGQRLSRIPLSDPGGAALPPKNFQDPDIRAMKMGSAPLRPSCPSRCRCACHVQRPGLVLVWLPESFIQRSRNLSEASDSSDDGSVFHPRLPPSEGGDDRGKWGPWCLKNKMASGGTHPRRRRSLRSSEYFLEGPGAGEAEAKAGVVLTSFKSTNENSFDGGSDSSPPESASMVNGEATESELRPLSTNRALPDAPQLETLSMNKLSGHTPSAMPANDWRLSRHIDSAPPLPQSEPPPLRSYRTRAELNDKLEDPPQPEVPPQSNEVPAPEDPNTDTSDLRDSTEDVSAEFRAKVRKPARRSKVPPLPLMGVEEKTPLMPPKVPSKPPRGAAPPPPPFVRKGSLKRYSAGNAEEVEQRDKESSSSLPTMYRPREEGPPAEQGACGADSPDCAHDIYRGGSVFMSPPVRSPKSIDWESHLRDEPLYQTYRQAVIKKEIRRQTVPRNSSFTSYDSSHDSPQSSGGSPKQGRRSAASHNSLWQELPAVKESGVLGGMSNEEKKMQESMFEVLTSEASYLRSLNVLIEHFMESRELDETLIVREKKILFSNVLKVKEVSERFLMDLEDRVEENIIITDVCDIIYAHSRHHFPVYIDYVRNQVFQEKTYSELLEKNPQFHAALCRLQDLPQCHRLPFMSFLLLPFQRITRIKMLIENILKRTEEGSEMEQNATNALDSVSKIIQECNREVGRMKQTEELIHIAQKIVFDKIKAVPIVSQNRFLEKQGELSEVLQKGSLFGIKPTKFSPVYFFLFNDFLLITQKKSSDKYVVVDHAHRSLVQVQSCPTIESSFFLTLLENHQGKMCERLFKASTQSDLHRWVAAFPNLNDDSLSGSDTIYEDWDCPQVQCIEPYSASQADELNLEPVDIINVLKKTSEGWYEGIRLSDGKKGWFPSLYVQEITNEHVRRRNLRERHRVLQAARQIQLNRFGEPRKKTGSA